MATRALSPIPRADWARARRGHANAPRLAAAVLLHALLFGCLWLALDRVQVPTRLHETWATLLEIVRPPPAQPHATAPMPPPLPVRAVRPPLPAPSPAARSARRPAERPPTTLPVSHAPPPPGTISVNATPEALAPSAASAPRASILDSAATRAAIHATVAGQALSERAADAAAVPRGSDMPNMDDDCPDCTQRHLAESKKGSERLSEHVNAAVKPDCLHESSSMGLFALPFLVVHEAAGKCTN